jgi:hypothetical protein
LLIVSIEIIESGGSQVAGQSYNLTCNVSDTTNVTSYQWDKEGESLNEIDKILSFPSLNLSNVGNYTCQVRDLNQTIIGISSNNWTIILPSKLFLYSGSLHTKKLLSLFPHAVIDMITVTSNEANPVPFFGSSFELICTVKLSPVAQELSESDNSKVKVTIEWDVPTSIMLSDNELSFEHSDDACIDSNTNVLQCEDTTYKNTITVTPFIPGFYNCTVTISVLEHQYYASMELLSNETRFTRG